MMICRVLSPAVPDLRPARRLAGLARPLARVQGRGTTRAAARSRRAAPCPSQATAGLGRSRGPRCADPAQDGLGAPTCRRKTKTWWRSTRISASLDASDRASKVTQPSTRRSIK